MSCLRFKMCILTFTLAIGQDVSLPVPVPPHISFPMSQEMVIVSSNYHHIKCQADGFPNISYTWYKDDTPLNDAHTFIKAFNNGSLLLYNFSNNLSGYFQCRARNVLGTSLSVKFPIFREISPPDVGPDQPPSLPLSFATESKSLSLLCQNVFDTLPRYNRRWYKSVESTELPITERIGTDAEGTLRFSYVLPTDTNIYKCGLLRPQGTALITFFYNNPVHVREQGNAPDQQCKLEYSTKTVKGYVDKSLFLECFFSGRPVPKVQWFDSNREDVIGDPSTYEVQDFGRRLEIKKLTEDHRGFFKCIGSNDLGTDTGLIQVNVTAPPMRIVSETNELTALSLITSPDSRTVTLHCNAKPAKYEKINKPTWYRNGDLLTQGNVPDPRRYSFNKDQTSLTIRHLKRPEDTACYQCNITNSEGYIFYDGYIHVIESIKVTKTPDSEINIKKGNGTLDLTVKAKGDSCCVLNYAWYFNGSALKIENLAQSKVFNYNGDGNLKFNSGNMSSKELAIYLGNYTCKVYNLYDSVNVTFRLTTSAPQPPEELVAGSGAFPYWLIILVICCAVILAAAVVIFVLVRRNFPGSTYPLGEIEKDKNLDPEEELRISGFHEI